MSAPAIVALIKNDLRLYLTDRRALVIGVLVPILIAAFFGYVFSGNDTPGKIAVGLVDEDHSDVSRAILAGMAGESMLAGETLARAAALARVRSGDLKVAVVIPEGFGAAAPRALFAAAPQPQVEFLIDPSQVTTSRVAEGLFTRYGMQAIIRAAFADGSRADGVPAIPGGLHAPYAIAMIPETSRQGAPYNSYAHSFAGMSTQFILFAGIDAGVALLIVRSRGIWQRLRAAPLTKTQFLCAKTLATTLISGFEFILIYGAAFALFGVRVHGSVAGFCAVALALCVLNATLGLMLASIGRSAGATRGIAILVTLLLVMLGGAWVPSFVFPRWLQQASLATPTRWAVDGLDAMTWRGLGFVAAVNSVAVLCITAALCLGIAIWQFRWQDDR